MALGRPIVLLLIVVLAALCPVRAEAQADTPSPRSLASYREREDAMGRSAVLQLAIEQARVELKTARNPNRLIVDIKTPKVQRLAPLTVRGSRIVNQARVGYHPGMIRIVLDLSGEFPHYELTAVDGEWIVRLWEVETGRVVEETPARLYGTLEGEHSAAVAEEERFLTADEQAGGGERAVQPAGDLEVAYELDRDSSAVGGLDEEDADSDLEGAPSYTASGGAAAKPLAVALDRAFVLLEDEGDSETTVEITNIGESRLQLLVEIRAVVRAGFADESYRAGRGLVALPKSFMLAAGASQRLHITAHGAAGEAERIFHIVLRSPSLEAQRALLVVRRTASAEVRLEAKRNAGGVLLKNAGTSAAFVSQITLCPRTEGVECERREGRWLFSDNVWQIEAASDRTVDVTYDRGEEPSTLRIEAGL